MVAGCVRCTLNDSCGSEICPRTIHSQSFASSRIGVRKCLVGPNFEIVCERCPILRRELAACLKLSCIEAAFAFTYEEGLSLRCPNSFSCLLRDICRRLLHGQPLCHVLVLPSVQFGDTFEMVDPFIKGSFTRIQLWGSKRSGSHDILLTVIVTL